MSIQKKYSRNEISKILKIASDLDQATIDKEDGLTEDELKKVAEETGLNPAMITKAIFQLENGETPIELSEALKEDYKFKTSFLADGIVDDQLWEEVVSEIRATHGGIGKISKMGSTYEWEQRKQNVGYIQVSVTPKGEYSKVSINSNYNIHSRVYGFFGAMVGLPAFTLLSEAFIQQQEISILFTFLGGFLGWFGSRFIVKNWMKKKTKVLEYMAKRVSNVISNHSPETLQGQISIDEGSYEANDLKSTKSKQRTSR